MPAAAVGLLRSIASDELAQAKISIGAVPSMVLQFDRLCCTSNSTTLAVSGIRSNWVVAS